MMRSRVKLRDVTVCAADSVHPELAARALELCLSRCDFADAILFSHVAVPGSFRCVEIERLDSLDDYSRFCLRDMGSLTATRYVLVVQWDGYVVDPSVWSDRFRLYDFIGAVASDRKIVGNGGFSLRSRRLLDAVSSVPLIPGLAEDVAICDTFRLMMERDHGIRFAPVKTAERFAYEAFYPGRATFGFHGLSNFWRHESDEEVLRIASLLSPEEQASWKYFGLIQSYLNGDREEPARRLYALARRAWSSAQIKRLMRGPNVPAEMVTATIDRLEDLLPGAAPHPGGVVPGDSHQS